MSYGKGLELEELIARLFAAKGYDIKHNVKLRGRSGVQHQIDIYAEYKAPLHISRIIIECKSHDKPIDKEIVVKLIYEVNDLGVDKGILVTTSYFTPDAVSTAEGYNIDLWDGSKLSEFLKEMKNIKSVQSLANVFYVTPAVPLEESEKIVNKSLKGFLGGSKGNIESKSVLFYPFYELKIDAKISEIKGFLERKVEERLVKATVIVDPVQEVLCDYDLNSGVIALLHISSLSDEEKKAFQFLLTHKSVTVPGMASLMNCSLAKARKILQGLVVKNLANLTTIGRQTFYELKVTVPNPLSLQSISAAVKVKEGEPREGIKINPTTSMNKVEEFISLLWNGRVNNFKILYYPYNVFKIVEKGMKYIVAVDARNNRLDERMSRILTSLYLQLPF